MSMTSSSSIKPSAFSWLTSFIREIASCVVLLFWSFNIISSLTFLYKQLKRFLTLFSVRPGKLLTISDHLLPICFLFFRISKSSSTVKGSLLISGFKKLYQRSLHCLPFRTTPIASFNVSAISCHYFVPFSVIILKSSSSSLLCHCVFVMEDLWF